MASKKNPCGDKKKTPKKKKPIKKPPKNPPKGKRMIA